MNVRNVTITEINEETWYACCGLEVSEEQAAHIEPNAVSIAQLHFEPTLKAYAIYTDDTLAGFLMFNTVPEELDGHWIYRIMIDKKFQGSGIGKAATQLMMNEMKTKWNAEKIVVGYHPENTGAHQLYKSLGFIDEGHRFGKEMAVIHYLNK